MSFESMMEQARLARLPEDKTITCTLVVLYGTKRYKQVSQRGFHVNVRYSFPDIDAPESELEEWAKLEE
jgi:hypothetical protein